MEPIPEAPAAAGAGAVTPRLDAERQRDGFSPANVAALLVGHCAGMLDLVGLPVWVGANLVGWFHLDPQKAGLLATLFLSGELFSSLILAPFFGRLPTKVVAVGGYSVAATAFLGLGTLTNDYAAMAALHLIGGLGAGAALTMVHGTMGRSRRPHRLFACAGLALACFGIVVLGSGPAIIGGAGGQALFLLFGAIMLAAALLAALAFPRLVPVQATVQAPRAPLSPRVWYGMAGMGLFCMAQSMIFPFVERIGMDRGYATALVSGVLLAIGFANLLPGPIAAALERRLPAESAILSGTLCHAAIVLVVTQLPGAGTYAAGVAILTTPLLFVHTFLFGLLARLDPSGRAVAATPAMLMVGSAIGPLLGGTLVVASGYRGLGLGVAAFGALAAAFFYILGRRAAATRHLPVQPALD